jgi:hypothetical protein
MEKSISMLTDAILDKEAIFHGNNQDTLSAMTGQRVTEWMGIGTSLNFAGEQLLNSYVLRSADPCQEELTSLRCPACSLPALCEETHDMLMSDSEGVRNAKDGIDNLLTELRQIGCTEQPSNFEHDKSPILLPPRQLLAMACTSLFQSGDFSTDLFCQSVFWANVDRIYNSPLLVNDNAWAICFNLIILLGVGAEPSNFGSGAEFLKPFILNITRAFGCTTLFLAPKLINIQTLALLVSFVLPNSHQR